MRKLLLFAIVIITTLISCKKEVHLPIEQTITKGSKWNILIGSTPEKVYSQIQQLSKSKSIGYIGLSNVPTYTDVKSIQNRISLYRVLVFDSITDLSAPIVFNMRAGKVFGIYKAGANFKPFPMWPDNISADSAIQLKDSATILYDKLVVIFKKQEWTKLYIQLSDKDLLKGYDIGMAKSNQWSFSFYEWLKNDKTGVTSMQLNFKNNILDNIYYTYNEGNIVID